MKHSNEKHFIQNGIMASAKEVPTISSENIRKQSIRLKIQISELSGISLTPELIVRGTSWQFKITKSISNGEESLGVYLSCAEKEVPTNWRQVAAAFIKLLPFRDNVDPIELYIQPYVFDATRLETSIEFASVIEWSELLDNTKGYVKDDKIHLELGVVAANPNENFEDLLNIEQIFVRGAECSFMLIIRSVENMMAVRSPTFEILGASLRLIGFVNQNNKIGVRLEPDGVSDKYPIDITMCLKLLGPDGHVKRETKKMTGRNCFIMYFEDEWDEWLKPSQDQNLVTFVEITLNAKKAELKRLKLWCPICLEAIFRQKISVTPCGHMFCTQCVTRAVTQYRKCPLCNTACNSEELVPINLPM